MTSKCFTYKNHQIEVMRYVTHTSWSGRQTVMWNAKVDGVPINSYSLHLRKSAVAQAKRKVDLLKV